MSVISVRDNENNKWKKNEKKKKEKKQRQKRTKAIEKGRELNDFVVRLSLALSIILKERELYESKHVVVECRCLKIWYLLSFLICSSILILELYESKHVVVECRCLKHEICYRFWFVPQS